jgi:RimJ/RimL family protein N-acetyltransferase
MITIRTLQQDDWQAIWKMMEPVFRAGETYSLDRNITQEQAFQFWVSLAMATYVAENSQGELLGSYYLKANQSGQGAHVANCGYVVHAEARGQGVASLMCVHSKKEAQRRNFLAMQFNFVVSSNTGAIRLWEKHGFDVVGTLPRAFLHPSLGYIDAHIMYQLLGSEQRNINL